MTDFRKIFYYLWVVVSLVLMMATCLSLFHHASSLWWIKSMNFPRQQMLAANVLSLAILVMLITRWTWTRWVLIGGLVTSIGIQLYFVLPYTPLMRKQVADVEATSYTAEHTVALLVVNVYMKNRQAQALLEMIGEKSPDMVLAMETDAWWQRALEPLHESYPYVMEYPLENTYGMMLYAKYPLVNPEILFLHHEKVPSFHARVALPNGSHFQFHGIHPVPPVPSSYPDNVGEEAVALRKLANLVAQETLPAVVAGDFNDVAWSHDAQLFQRDSQLRDIRIGRGMYNSFNAHSRVMRWPLDHVYVTDAFKVVEMQRLASFGSDHFPIYVKLALTQTRRSRAAHDPNPAEFFRAYLPGFPAYPGHVPAHTPGDLPAAGGNAPPVVGYAP